MSTEMLKNKRKKKSIKLRAYKGFPLVLRNNILETGNGIFFFFEIETLLLLNKKMRDYGKKGQSDVHTKYLLHFTNFFTCNACMWLFKI